MTTPQQHVEVLRNLLRGVQDQYGTGDRIDRSIGARKEAALLAAIAALQAQPSAPGGEVTEQIETAIRLCSHYEAHKRMTDFWRPAFASIRNTLTAALAARTGERQA